MTRDIIGLALSYAFVFAAIGTATFFMKRGIFSPAVTRKIVHISVSNWWVIAMIFFSDPVTASIGPVTFIILNWISWKTHLFRAMEDPNPSGNLGTIYFPISLLILVNLCYRGVIPVYAGGIGVLIMGSGAVALFAVAAGLAAFFIL